MNTQKRSIAARLLGGLLLAMAGQAMAYTAIATIPGHVNVAWYYASNYTTQKKADADALEGCRVNARSNGQPQLAGKCVIATRARGPGYGAISCGDEGCRWVTGYSERQEAVDVAYRECTERYANCNDKEITNWKDLAGFPETRPKAAAAPKPGASCIPQTAYRECRSRCTNGNCVVTYSNGCKVQVTVQPSMNPFTHQLEFPAPGC